MSKTGWTMTAAAVLVAARRAVLGPDIEGERGWFVTLKIDGELPGGTKTLSLPLPPEFRRQHLWGEKFEGKGLIPPSLPKRRQTARRVVWHRHAAMDDRSLPFSLTYSFRAQVAVRQTTGGMNQGTRRLDRTPPDKTLLLPSRLIQSDAPPVQKIARQMLEPLRDASPESQVRALFDFVADLSDGDANSARTCLKFNAGSSIGKARLLVALCRCRGVPARVLTGIVLDGEGTMPLHSWAEAWVHGRWLAMDPTSRHFGSDEFPDTYFVLHIGDGGYRPGQGRNVQVDCQVQDLSPGGDHASDATPLRAFLLHASLFKLRPTEQHLVRFLLLLPLAALVVNVYRTVIGVPTFGTFSPALLGLAFLDMRALRWGLPIFVLIILLGWTIRHGLERFHLLQVPRASALLTLIVALLIVLIVVSNHFHLSGMQYISLFPLVILTHLVERFWTIEAEDGTMSSFKTLVGTVVVAITVSVALSPEAVGSWLFRYPETLIVVLAAHLALGRYTGYRLSELYRFADIIHEESPEVKKDDSVRDSGAAAAGNGSAETPDAERRAPDAKAGA